MKKLLAVIFSVSILLVSCAKKYPTYNPCVDVAPSSEDSIILAFCAKDTIAAIKDTNGLYYQIITPGVGAVPTANSRISASYLGSLLNGTVFDWEKSPVSFTLGATIPGWQLGIPYIKKGGHIKLIIPSAYAYGCTGYGSAIPANSPLFFDIQLVDVQ